MCVVEYILEFLYHMFMIATTYSPLWLILRLILSYLNTRIHYSTWWQEWLGEQNGKLTPWSSNFKHPDEWPCWKRFGQFWLASGLTAKSEQKQISTFLYCMGEAAEDTFSLTDISPEDRAKLQSMWWPNLTLSSKSERTLFFECAHFNC